MTETENYTSGTLLRLLLTRIISITLYLAAYKNIELITKLLLYISKHHVILSLLLPHVKLVMNPRLFPKTFVLIVLFSTALMPIIRDLLKGIAADTMLIWFFIFQVIFCIDTIRISILNKGETRQVFDRNEVLSLEESMLITKKLESNGIVGDISALLGFFGTLSRVKDDVEVMVLLAIGFITYHFVSKALEKCLVHVCTSRLVLVMVIVSVIEYLVDRSHFSSLLLFISIISILWTVSTKLIERNILRFKEDCLNISSKNRCESAVYY